jgi:hydrogenase maturation protease
MTKVLVIGYGNQLRSDDALGWYAIGQLAVALDAKAVTLIARHQLTPDLAGDMRHADLVIFVEARNGSPAGKIIQSTVEPVSAAATFTHNSSPAILLAKTQALYGVSPETVVFSVNGASFDFGEKLTPPVQEALPKLVERIHALVNERTMQRA